MVDIKTKESPFSPGRPVPVEYFVARHKEIERIERSIRQTASGRNENIFVAGERGIGKSSLAGFARYIAQKEYGLLGSHCFLGGVNTVEGMISVIFQRLLQDCTDKSIFDRLWGIFSDYAKQLTLFGLSIEFTKDEGKLRALVENFLPVMRKICDEVQKANRKGLILVLDDLNGITKTPEFAHFIKSFVDELSTSGQSLPLLLILVGMPERRDEMINIQPSVGRIFTVIDLPLMSEDESKEFFTETLGKKMVTVADDALSLMVNMAGGYPMLMHELGDAVFWQDENNQIDIRDAKTGISEAAKNVGRKYIGTQVESVFRNRTYSSILVRMGKKLPIGSTFKRKDLIKESVSLEEQKNLDNFLGKVKQLGIMREAETYGEYRFVNPLYHLYIWYMAREKSASGKSK